MVTIYRADDGTEFFNEDDCELYEFEKSLKGLRLADHLLDIELNPVDSADESFYVYAATNEEMETLNYIFDRCGLEEPYDGEVEAPLIVCYNYDNDSWTSMDELVAKANEVIALNEKLNDIFNN